MLDHLRSLDVSFRIVDAVDGRSLTESQKQELLAPGTRMHDGAIGCYLSHLKVYQAMLDEDIAVALVLEDDARVSPQISQTLSMPIDGSGFDYCFLDSDDHNDQENIFFDQDDSVPIANGVRAHHLSAGPQTTHAYLISLPAARKRLESALPMQKAIDLYDHLPYPIKFRAIVKPKLAWVGQDSLESFTSERRIDAAEMRFSWARRSPAFYRLRDLLKLRPIKRLLEIRRLIRAGALDNRRNWAPLPSGREIIL